MPTYVRSSYIHTDCRILGYSTWSIASGNTRDAYRQRVSERAGQPAYRRSFLPSHFIFPGANVRYTFTRAGLRTLRTYS